MANSKVKIIVHTLIKNEDRFIWYAINSVLKYVDEIMVWDTGSEDSTVNIVKTISSRKINFKQVGSVDASTFTNQRQRMLDETPDDFTWVMILDGDEVWPEKSIQAVTDFARNNPDFESIVVRTHNLVGDIYHRLPESVGHYHLAGRTGHLNLRLLNRRKIPGLNVQKPHGQQGYFDGKGVLVQERNQAKIQFIDVTLHHASHLRRSQKTENDLSVIKRAKKFKYQIGERIPKSEIPEIFFASRSDIVPDVSKPADISFWILALFATPLKILKRKLLPIQSGY